MLKTSYTSAQYLNEANSLTYAYGKINAVVIADIDGNGFADLVTFPSNFTMYPELQPLVWANTNGVFSARPDLVSGPSSFQYFRDAIPGDFTGDGISDYLMMDQGFELDNRNSAAFQFSQPKFYVGTGSGLKAIPTNEFLVAGNNDVTFNHIGASADFNGDGKLDAVIASFAHLRILVNDGLDHFTTREDLVPVKFNNGEFQASGATFIRVGSAYGLVAGAYKWADLNINPGDLSVMTQQNGVFVEIQTLPRPNLGQKRERYYGAVDMTNIDVNADGREDLVVTWETEATGLGLSNTIATVYFQDASGRLYADPTGAVYNLAGKGAGVQIYFQDFNKDGYLDFWNSTYGIHPSKFNELVWYNDGTGHFATNLNGPFNTNESFPDWYLTNAFFFDANNDGVVDVVAAQGVFPQPPTHTIGEQVRVFLSVAPSISIASDKSNLLAGQTAVLTFTLNVASTTFTSSDVTVSGGTLSNFSGSGASYTATFTPTANSTTNGVISVASGTFTDAAGNANADGSDANNRVTLALDTLPPMIAIASSSTSLTAGQTATISFTLSESSTTFTSSDVSVSGGTLSNFGGSGTSYTASFTPTANSTTNGVISVASGTFTDAAGNANADGSDANNTVTLTVNTVASSGNDKLTGTSGNDYIGGLAGNDTLTGLAGDDTLDGGVGNDSMVGGLGDDTYYVDSTGDKVVELANQGADTVVSDISLSLAKFANVENWVGIGSANIAATGNALGNALTGNSGSNTIDGGLGKDTLTGGAGADTFVFSTKLGLTNTDTITDFVSGTDKIQLSKSVFSKFKAGAVPQANFVSGDANAKALDSNDYLIFNGSQLLYDADGSGKGVAVVVANIVGTVVASDLVVV